MEASRYMRETPRSPGSIEATGSDVGFVAEIKADGTLSSCQTMSMSDDGNLTKNFSGRFYCSVVSSLTPAPRPSYIYSFL